MDSATTALTAITGLFFILLALKQFLPSTYGEKMCALCLAVSTTWAGLLTAHWTNMFHDTALLGLLMGSTVLGVFYTVDDRIDGPLELFRLPLYLTLLVTAYALMTASFHTGTVSVIALLWTGFGLLYLYRENERVNEHVERIIACCKGW